MFIREGAIEELLREAGVRFKLTSNSVITDCPRCKKRDKLYMYRRSPYFTCWVCAGDRLTGFQGKTEYALTELIGSSVQSIKEALYGKQHQGPVLLDVDLRSMWDESDGEDILTLAEIEEIFPDPEFFTLDDPAAQRGVNYLEGRGVSKEVAMTYDIRYNPSTKRVIFPVKHQNKWVGYQGRYVESTTIIDETGKTGEVLKAVTSKNLKRSEVLMFSERVTGDSAILCEGPFDALKAHLCGGNVATMGKKVSKGQLNILRYCGIKKLYLALDPDAYKEAQNIVKEMSGEMEVYDMRPPLGYKDLGEMSMEEVLALQKTAKRVTPAYLFIGIEDKYERKRS